ncbi:unnamed protein product, partial [Rotaria sp. Silwood1]
MFTISTSKSCSTPDCITYCIQHLNSTHVNCVQHLNSTH